MLEDILREGFAELGVECPDPVLARFRAYYELLTARNAVMNLTAISGEAETARLHFLDSASPLRHVPMEGTRVIDVGSGAGFPGVVLKLLCPSLRLTLLDSQRKRVDFLTELCALLGLEDVECVHARAEDVGPRRERYDFAVSRAVARMNVLTELCLPYVKPGGAFLALKGPAASGELAEADRAFKTLGGTVEAVYDEPIPGGDTRHNLVVTRKTAPTPRRYPRPYGQIKKSPL